MNEVKEEFLCLKDEEEKTIILEREPIPIIATSTEEEPSFWSLYKKRIIFFLLFLLLLLGLLASYYIKSFNPNRPVKEEKLIIPKEKPKDFKFAEGLWMSNEELYSGTNPDVKIVLYFDIKRTGKGILTLSLSENNEKCKSNIELSFDEKKLSIMQLDDAKCNKSNTYYSKYHFTCVASSEDIAICNAKGNNEITFELIKI